MSETHGPGKVPPANAAGGMTDPGAPGETSGTDVHEGLSDAQARDAAADGDGDRFAAALATLRADGAETLDPVGLHYLEALHRRTLAASGEPRRLLELRLDATLARASQRLEEARALRDRQAGARPTANPTGETGLASLRALNRRLDALARMPAADGAAVDQAEEAPGGSISSATPQDAAAAAPVGRAPGELRALRRFRRSWSRISAEDQVRRALVRGPEQAGPLNSHMLVLRSLELMRALSPDYLQRFLSRADALLWLEQAEAPRPAAEARPARRTRRKKDAPPAG